MAKGILRKFFKNMNELLLGKDSDDENKSVAEKLQVAVRSEIELANLKETTAATAMSAAVVYRQELGKLVAQAEELQRQALKFQKAGDEAKAKRILALKLAIDEKITAQSEVYQRSNEVAKNSILAAKKQFQTAQAASQDLPRRVMQIEINSMMEKAQKFEKAATKNVGYDTNYKALASSIDLKSAQLSARALIEDSSEIALEDQVTGILKDARFEQEYVKLLEASKTVSEAEFSVVEDSPATKARALLTESPFGGLIPNLTSDKQRSA
jgi:hypothetical protein